MLPLDLDGSAKMFDNWEPEAAETDAAAIFQPAQGGLRTLGAVWVLVLFSKTREPPTRGDPGLNP